MKFPLQITWLLLTALWLQGCSSDAVRPAGPSAASSAVDFSGAWEVDYSKSENIRDVYDAMLREFSRQVERQQRSMNQRGGTTPTGVPLFGSGEDLYALARLAELITDYQLLNITQSPVDITVKREGTFALYCEFDEAQYYTQQNALGREVCGWDGHQLVFQIYLPDGIAVYHRFTLGPEGKRINVSTTVRSERVSYPFTLNRVYNRYDPNSSGIRCKQTLTRGRVCTTESEDPWS